jgi:hypothetical protein
VYEDASDLNKKAVLLTKRDAIYDPAFKGGVRLAVLDNDGDGSNEILAAAGPGDERRVLILSGLTLAQVDQFFAEDEQFTAGLFVAGARLL